jgi:hypothetical protein
LTVDGHSIDDDCCIFTITAFTAVICPDQARFNFTLSAMDVANGFGRFEVVPEPGTLALAAVAAFAGAAAIWRRRTTR